MLEHIDAVQNVDEILESVIAPYRVKVDDPTPHTPVDEHIMAHPIELVSVSPGDEPVEAALSQFEQLRPQVERLLLKKSADDYVPLVIIFNSVMAAMYAAEHELLG